MRSFLQSRNQCVALNLAAVAVLMYCEIHNESKAGPPNDRSPLEEARELRRKRVSVVTSIYEVMRDRYNAGKIPLDGVIDARIAVFQAKLDLCETGDDRLVVLSEMVRVAEEMVERARNDRGDKSLVSLFAEDHLLKARIALEKERASK